MLYVNLFADGEALPECEPQGDAFSSLMLAPEDANAVAALITSAEVLATLARLFRLRRRGARASQASRASTCWDSGRARSTTRVLHLRRVIS
jgi:hypothetical protein